MTGNDHMDEIYFSVAEAERVIQRVIDNYEDPWVVWELSYSPGSNTKYHFRFVMPTVKPNPLTLKLIHGDSMREVMNQAAQWVAGGGLPRAIKEYERRSGKSVSSVLSSNVRGA